MLRFSRDHCTTSCSATKCCTVHTEGGAHDGSHQAPGPRGRRLEFLAKRLDLSDEQVHSLRERLGEHRRQTVTIIRDVLTDEQRAKFDAHLERRKARGRGHGRRRGRGGWDDAGSSPAPAPETDLGGPTDAA